MTFPLQAYCQVLLLYLKIMIKIKCILTFKIIRVAAHLNSTCKVFTIISYKNLIFKFLVRRATHILKTNVF